MVSCRDLAKLDSIGKNRRNSLIVLNTIGSAMVDTWWKCKVVRHTRMIIEASFKVLDLRVRLNRGKGVRNEL